jgi:hypothetical protein
LGAFDELGKQERGGKGDGGPEKTGESGSQEGRSHSGESVVRDRRRDRRSGFSAVDEAQLLRYPLQSRGIPSGTGRGEQVRSHAGDETHDRHRDETFSCADQ